MAAQRPVRGREARLPRPRLGSRVLREGMRGADVEGLQAALSRLGFYGANPDSIFGFLTKEAVREFQREALLTCDGIAGPEVFRALAAFPRQRMACVVGDGDTLDVIARRLGVSPGLLTAHNRTVAGPGAPLPLGATLMVPCRSLLVSCYPASETAPGHLRCPVRLETVAGLVTAAVTRCLEVSGDGNVGTPGPTPIADRLRRLCVLFGKPELLLVVGPPTVSGRTNTPLLRQTTQDAVVKAVSAALGRQVVEGVVGGAAGGVVFAVTPAADCPGSVISWERTVRRVALEVSARGGRMRVVVPHRALSHGKALSDAVRALDAAVFRFVTDSPPLSDLPLPPWRFEVSAGWGSMVGVEEVSVSASELQAAEPLTCARLAVSGGAAGVFLWPPGWWESDLLWKGVGDCMAVRAED